MILENARKYYAGIFFPQEEWEEICVLFFFDSHI